MFLAMRDTTWDILITGGLVFDGHGAMPTTEDVAIADGRIVARGRDLDPALAARVVEAEGRWVLPGMLDIHTHYDLEVELAPGLPEAARHGTTTVVMSNCSLGTTYGHQRRDNGEYVEDPIIDCFARVENIPKHVLTRAADEMDWTTSAEYLAHLDGQPLGANVVPQIPHSMLRAQVMGLRDSVSRDPSHDEIVRMGQLLNRAMKEGYAGFSTDALPFHYLSNDPNRKTKIPTQWTTREELKTLTHVVRHHDRVWQGTPPKDSPVDTVKTFGLTSGRLFGSPLRTTIVAAMDVNTDRTILPLAKVLMAVFNSRLVDGNFRMQALAAEFKVWADGPLTPLCEEIPELRELNEPDLEDREGRTAILDDPDWQARFRTMWNAGKDGKGLRGFLKKVRIEPWALPTDHEKLVIDGDKPVAAWKGLTFADLQRRVEAFRAGRLDTTTEEAAELRAFPADVEDDASVVIHLLRTYDLDFRWYAITANSDRKAAKAALTHRYTLPGFNDSGAHLTNMAFYDANLRGLQWVMDDGLAAVSRHIMRLTKEPADFWQVDAGTLDVGAVADVVVIDPARLRGWDPEPTIELTYRDDLGDEVMVNRPEGIVTTTVVGGTVAWDGVDVAPEVGKVRLGRTLLATG